MSCYLYCRHALVDIHIKYLDNYITLEKARFLAEKIYQIDYFNPYDNKRKSVLLHTKEEPEVTELLDIISANC